MKKVLFSVCALAALLTGCAKSDVVDAPNFETPITFEAYSGKVPVSKATSIESEADLSDEGGFIVYAYETTTEDAADYSKEPYINGENLTLPDNGGDDDAWSFDSADKVYYWPSDGSKLHFVAYGKNDITTYNTPSTESAPSVTVTIPDALANQKDVMIAKAVTTKTPDNNSSVALQFQHVLSRVHFALVNEDAVTIKSVKINGAFKNKATFAFGELTPDFTDATDVESYSVISTPVEYAVSDTDVYLPTLTTDDGKENHYMMILPGDPSEVVIEYTYPDDVTNSVYVATANLEADDTVDPAISNFTFEANKSYLFRLNLSRDKITLNANITGWDTSTESTSSALTFEITKQN